MIKIYTNVPIPKANRVRLSAFSKKVIDMISNDTIKVGDMFISTHDCSSIRFRIYPHKLTVRFNRKNNKYNVWRIK